MERCGAAARSDRGRPIPWRSTCQAAHVLGDPALEKRFEACSAAIHRGVPFANSLYVLEQRVERIRLRANRCDVHVPVKAVDKDGDVPLLTKRLL